MKWSGKVQPGAGESTGETTELANSYLSRFGGTTRHMTKAGITILLQLIKECYLAFKLFHYCNMCFVFFVV